MTNSNPKASETETYSIRVTYNDGVVITDSTGHDYAAATDEVSHFMTRAASGDSNVAFAEAVLE